MDLWIYGWLDKWKTGNCRMGVAHESIIQKSTNPAFHWERVCPIFRW